MAQTEADKRAELKNRIEAGEQRNAERSVADYAREARDSATDFVKAHPVATVVGGIAAGVLIASLVPGPGRRLRKKASKRTSALAAMLAEVGLAYGTTLLDGLGDAAKIGRERLGDLGDSARDLGHDAGARASAAGEEARRLTQDVGERAVRKVRDLRAHGPLTKSARLHASGAAGLPAAPFALWRAPTSPGLQRTRP